MPNFDDLSDRILRATGNMPGLAVGAVVLFLYAGVGLALPLALGLSIPGLVIANFFGTMLAGMMVLGWLTVQVENAKRRHLVDWTTNLRHLNAEEFEWLVGEVFRPEGWKVRETGRQDAPDGNIDLELSREGRRMIAQCKLWQSWQVGVDTVRQFAGTLAREGLPMSAGLLVTSSDFTGQARAEAGKMGMVIVDGGDLHDRIEKVRRVELCPKCQKPMRLDHSSQGWWFHCVAGCPGKRDLGKHPGRAVEFLTQPPVT